MAFTGRAYAREHVIEFFRSSFLPQSISVEVGDTVRFVWQRGEHVVASGEGPEDPDAGVLFDVPIDEANPEFILTIVPSHGEGIAFFDRLHPAQLGFIDITAGERTFRVGVVDNVFLPDLLHIFEGDSVRWEHEPLEGIHTVTSGRSSHPDDNPGALFDVESSEVRPLFVYRFDDAGEYPYFCRPHEHLGMTGMVIVERRFVRGDATRDNEIDMSDAIAMLGELFRGEAAPGCADALDANDDGAIDVSDPVFVLLFLFLGEMTAPPPPFPLPGADRTEDALVCL